MDAVQIIRILKNAGFHGLALQGGQTILMEDPSCVLRAFADFAEFAWFVMCVVTCMLLFGWGVALIRGSTYKNIFMNLRNVVLIFGIITAAGPILKFMWGDDLFARGCETIKISVSDIQEMLDMRNAKLATSSGDLYEILDIYYDGEFSDVYVPDNAGELGNENDADGDAGGDGSSAGISGGGSSTGGA